MASTINASNTGFGGIVSTGDSSGSLALQAGGTTIATVSSTGLTMNAGNIVQASTAAPAFSAYQSVAQSGVASLSATKVTFTTVEYDTNSNFSSSRFTPTVAGYYQVNACVGMTSAATTATLLTWIYKNGSVAKTGSISTGSTYLYPQSNASAVIYCNGSTDYIEIYVLGSAGGSSFTTYTGINNTYFQAFLARSA